MMSTVDTGKLLIISHGKKGRTQTAQVIWHGETYHCRKLPSASAGKRGEYVGGRKVNGAFEPQIRFVL